MPFKKLRFGQGKIYTTIVEDQDGRELQKFKVMEQDFPRVVKILSKTFGLNMKIIDKSDNDKDLNWAI